MNRDEKRLGTALLTLVLSLLLVGWISGTVIRHVVQVVPALVAGVAVVQRRSWGRMAAVPVLAFWLFIMVLIWLYLLNVVRLMTGRFSTAEIILTMVMGLACVAGLVASLRMGRRSNWLAGLATALFFVALQFAVMWVSFRPTIAHR